MSRITFVVSVACTLTSPLAPAGTMAALALMRPAQRVQRRNRRLRLSRGPYRQVAQISLRNDSDVERIGGCGSGNPTVGSAGNREVLVRATLNRTAAAVRRPGIHHPAGGDGNELLRF